MPEVTIVCKVCSGRLGRAFAPEYFHRSSFTAEAPLCSHCYNIATEREYKRGEELGRAELEEAVRAALEEGREEGYGEGLRDGRRLGRQEAQGGIEDRRISDIRVLMQLLMEIRGARVVPEGDIGSTLREVTDALSIILQQAEPPQAELAAIHDEAQRSSLRLLNHAALTFNIAIARSLERAFLMWGKL